VCPARHGLFRSGHCSRPLCSGRASGPMRPRTSHTCSRRTGSRRLPLNRRFRPAFQEGLAATSSIPSSTTARLGGFSTSPGTSRRSSSSRPLDRRGSLPRREFDLRDDVHVAPPPEDQVAATGERRRGSVDTVAIAIRAPTLKKLAPGRPVAKERPPPDQSGVAADCATRTHENDRGVTSRWHPSNEGSDGPSRLVSGTARPIPMLGS
jgi:hypothetical protein